MKSAANLSGVLAGESYPVRIMGVLNISPESFYRGSVFAKEKDLAAAVKSMVGAGADMLDVGAMSTAPYLETNISAREEAKRLRWAVRFVRRHCELPISVDTSRLGPALDAFEEGATILNDVTGLTHDPALKQLVPSAKGLILMANSLTWKGGALTKPVPHTTQILRQALQAALQMGFKKERIVLDPGIGFFRKARLPWWKWDLEVLKNLSQLKKLGRPLLVGLSRKSFIGEILGGRSVEGRLSGSLAATALAVQNGASLIRTHDVQETKDAVRVAEELRRNQGRRNQA